MQVLDAAKEGTPSPGSAGGRLGWGQRRYKIAETTDDRYATFAFGFSV